MIDPNDALDLGETLSLLCSDPNIPITETGALEPP